MNMNLMQIQINGSGVDSGEVDYLIYVANLESLFTKSHLVSRKAYKKDILSMLDRLRGRVENYYDECLISDPLQPKQSKGGPNK